MKKVFISFAGEQRKKLAKPLADCLSNKGLSVWYDEYQLRIGDKIRNSIDRGINNCDFGILILSPEYLEKNWTNYELDGLFNRDLVNKRKFLLPIWHKIKFETINRFSPTLADRKGIPSSVGVEQLCKELYDVIQVKEIDKQQTKLLYSFTFYHNRYYNPPYNAQIIGELIPSDGDWRTMNSNLRKGEIIIACFYNQVPVRVATHVPSIERKKEIESTWKNIKYYAVDVEKANEGFDRKLDENDINRIKNVAIE